MNPEVISIIVPVYNTEKYLRKCVDSIVKQTYGNLEIILVDDGSTDTSAQICEEYGKNDARIVVIHKRNGGLSSARNAGLDICSGQYVGFVDSDDYVSENMYKALYDMIVKTQSDIAICGCEWLDENAPAPEAAVLSGQAEVYSSAYLLDHLYTAPCAPSLRIAVNKLYKRAMFDSLRFPEGKLHEDEFVAHYLYGLSASVAVGDFYGYYYVQREGSITHTRSAVNLLHVAEAYLDRAVYAESLGAHSCAGESLYHAAALFSGISADDCRQKLPPDEVASFLAKWRENVGLRSYCNAKRRLFISLMGVYPALCRFVSRKLLMKNKYGRRI